MIARDHEEVELKFRLQDRRAGDRLLAASSLGGLSATGIVSVVRVEDRYIDTPGFALRGAGYAARIRERGGDLIVTIKALTRGGNGRVHRRREVEGGATPSLDPAAWPASPARSLVQQLRGEAPLVDVVTIRQVRRQRVFSGPTAAVELSVDEVQVVANRRIVERFNEVEAELTSGDPGVLGAVGDHLASLPGTSEAASSKLDAALAAIGHPVAPPIPLGPSGPATERSGARGSAAGGSAAAASGTALSGGRSAGTTGTAVTTGSKGKRSRVDGVPAGARSPGVLGDDPVAEAGRKVLAFHLARMIAREPGTRDGEVGELHQMRVATRRMRAAWRVFEDGFDVRRTRGHRTRLRRVARLLGAVRDLDVLLEGLGAYGASLSPAEQHGLEPLGERWRRQRDVARRALVRELDGGPYRRWRDAFVEFCASAGTGVRPLAPTEPQRIRDTAPARIWAAFARVRGYETVLRWADVPTLHELRITAKWLRYTLEFHADALGSDAAWPIARVTALQDHLGLMHDADVAADLTRAFLDERGAALGDGERASIGRYLLDREAEVVRLRNGVGAPWRGVAGLSFRRRLGRLVAEL